eukprot:gene19708-biopygen35832
MRLPRRLARRVPDACRRLECVWPDVWPDAFQKVIKARPSPQCAGSSRPPCDTGSACFLYAGCAPATPAAVMHNGIDGGRRGGGGSSYYTLRRGAGRQPTDRTGEGRGDIVLNAGLWRTPDPATRVVVGAGCATAGALDGPHYLEAPCPDAMNGSSATQRALAARRCAEACDRDANCSSFQLGTAMMRSDTRCVVWRHGACDGPAGRLARGATGIPMSGWGTAAGRSVGSLFRKVPGGEGTLPVASPNASANAPALGVLCYAKCDDAWCHEHGSAALGSDGRCECTCFSALGWVGRRCDECGGVQPFFPVRTGDEVTCTLCTNNQHCNGHAQL